MPVGPVGVGPHHDQDDQGTVRKQKDVEETLRQVNHLYYNLCSLKFSIFIIICKHFFWYSVLVLYWIFLGHDRWYLAEQVWCFFRNKGGESRSSIFEDNLTFSHMFRKKWKHLCNFSMDDKFLAIQNQVSFLSRDSNSFWHYLISQFAGRGRNPFGVWKIYFQEDKTNLVVSVGLATQMRFLTFLTFNRNRNT